MDRERGNVDWVLAFNDFAARVHQDQIGSADMPEMHAERIDPEVIRPLRIARRNVTGHALVETELGKKTKAGGQTFFAMPAFLPYRCELRNRRNFENACRCGAHCTPRRKFIRIIAPRAMPATEAWSLNVAP